MDIVKIVIVAILAWLLLGGRGIIPKERYRKAPTPSAEAIEPAEAEPKSENKASSRAAKTASPAVFQQPPSLIASLDYLKSNAQTSFAIPQVRVTYYLIAKSERCAVDSLEACLQDRIRAAQIDARDFQYTYFLDRVINAGTGILTWQEQKYLVRFDKLRENNWTIGERAPKNKYACSGFVYKSKKAVEFINANLSKKDLFTPLAEVEHPNGLTISGQPALDWLSLAVNPVDFPMSVPEPNRRATLTQRFTAKGGKAPVARAFVVLEFSNGQKYLTEATDGGSGVQKGWVDWRIGNSSPEIRYFQALGSSAKATCFVFNDANVTIENALEKSRK